MSTIDDAINRDLSWAEATHEWVKDGLGASASAVTIDADGYRQQVRVVRDRDGDALWVEDETITDDEGETSDEEGEYLVAVDDDGDRIIEGAPDHFWAKLRGWATS